MGGCEKKRSVGKILNIKPTMVCMSQWIQKKSRKRGKESDRKEEKGEKGDTAHGMSHKKKAELTCCFFLSRSLHIFIASRSRNSSTATHLHMS